MIDAYLTEEQLALQKLAHEFAEREVRPIEMYLRNAYNMLHSDGGIIMKKLKVMNQMCRRVHAGNGVEVSV